MRASLLFVLLVGLAACKDLSVEEVVKSPAKVAAKKPAKEAAVVVSGASEEDVKVAAKAPKVAAKSAKLADAAPAALNSTAEVPAAVVPLPKTKTSASTKTKVEAENKPLKRVKRGPATYQTCVGNNDNGYDTTSKLLAYLQQLTYQLQYCDNNQGCGGYYGGYYGCGSCPYGGYWPNCYYPPYRSLPAAGDTPNADNPQSVPPAGQDPRNFDSGVQQLGQDPFSYLAQDPKNIGNQVPQGRQGPQVPQLSQGLQVPRNLLFQNPDPNAARLAPINGQFEVPSQFPNPRLLGGPNFRSFPSLSQGEATTTPKSTTTTAPPSTPEECDYSADNTTPRP